MVNEQFNAVRNSVAELTEHAHALSDAFYRHLFRLDPEIEKVFRDDAEARYTKYLSMLSTFKNIHQFEAIKPALKSLGERHQKYGVQPDYYRLGSQAQLLAMREVLGGEGNDTLLQAWKYALDSVVDVMSGEQASDSAGKSRDYYSHLDETHVAGRDVVDAKLLNEIGGREVIERVHRRFYTVIFDDEWLGRFFFGKNLEALVKKQTDFLVACFGGPNEYRGETPAIAHMHMFITDEMLDLRESLLRQAIRDEGLSESIIERWMKVEEGFRDAIVKKGADECVMRCMGQRPVVAEKPKNYPWPPKKSA